MDIISVIMPYTPSLSTTEIIVTFIVSLFLSTYLITLTFNGGKRRELKHKLLHLKFRIRGFRRRLREYGESTRERRERVILWLLRVERGLAEGGREDEGAAVDGYTGEGTAKKKQEGETQEEERQEWEEDEEEKEHSWDILSDSHSDVTTSSATSGSSFPPDSPSPLGRF
ncbi:hypothetical protein FQN54_005406 [Arachnomyces sp. PD_36]|nr:hypothetical protein FQN54_005406 [Arachnomyces sp. PD_36]